MQRVVRYLLPVVVGVALGLGLLWLTGGFGGGSSAANVPVVPAGTGGSGAGAAPSPSAGVSPSPAASLPLPALPARPAAPAAIGTEYLALGDSVAYGIGAPDPVNQGYAGTLYANYLRRVQPNLSDYRNLAVPGETSATFLNASKGASQLQRLLDEVDAANRDGRKISPVTLTLGGNDLLNLQGKSETERQAGLTSFEANYTRILDTIRARLSGTDLIVTLYYNPLAYQGSGQNQDSVWLQRFNNSIRTIGLAHGAKIADFFNVVNGQEGSLTWASVGDVHPTPSGHAILAAALWRATGYDKQPPSLALTYSPLPANGKVSGDRRLVFKLAAWDDWAACLNPADDSTISGAGAVTGVSVSLDGVAPVALTTIPTRYTRLPGGMLEYSYTVDTSSLASGPHTLHFMAQDAASNAGTLDVKIEIT